MYSFAAERQLIFYANVGGRSRLIQFGERNHAGASVFMTQEEKVAEAVRRNSMFKRGVITETTIKEEVKPVIAEAEPQRTEQTGKAKKNAKGGKKGSAKKGGKNAAPVKAESVKAEAEPQRTEQEAKSFRDFSHAREWFGKEYGVSRKELRNPTMLAEYAKKYNVTIKYEEI